MGIVSSPVFAGTGSAATGVGRVGLCAAARRSHVTYRSTFPLSLSCDSGRSDGCTGSRCVRGKSRFDAGFMARRARACNGGQASFMSCPCVTAWAVAANGGLVPGAICARRNTCRYPKTVPLAVHTVRDSRAVDQVGAAVREQTATVCTKPVVRIGGHWRGSRSAEYGETRRAEREARSDG